MRLVIDLQGAQSTGSRNRGIGRYVRALTKEIIRQKGQSEVILALNGAFPETIETLRAEFEELLPSGAIRIWLPPTPCNSMDKSNEARRIAAEGIYEAFLSDLEPDVLLISSLFEGLVDDVATSVSKISNSISTAIILYDLIPLIHSEVYLNDSHVSRWYHQKIDHLRRADLLLSISESSQMEAVEQLAFPKERVVNISTACDDGFRKKKLSNSGKQQLNRMYGLSKPYVMYTGGIDYRKNIEGLIRAFALLPKSLQSEYQLAVVCSASEADRTRLKRLACDVGLNDNELVMTGYVPEADLLALYNECSLFVFPSLHEGFGLPALEAMACGRPTIGSNTSSLPEVIGWDEATFDPHDDTSIARLMQKALTDKKFNQSLERRARKQAKKFSWQQTAQSAWRALNGLKQEKNSPAAQSLARSMRPRLAYLSPLPSARSGIADYSAELIPELSRRYDIDVIVEQLEPLTDPWIQANAKIRSVDWFKKNHYYYDRVLYNFGNSPFHAHMFELLEKIPGVVVLHDFYLSNINAHLDWLGQTKGRWPLILLADHGWAAVKRWFETNNPESIISAYPGNGEVVRNALGVIVHSLHSLDLMSKWHGSHAVSKCALINLPRKSEGLGSEQQIARRRSMARRNLRLSPDDFIVCSFGHLGKAKLNDRLINAWRNSQFANKDNCKLVFVGQNDAGAYGEEISNLINRDNSNVFITGFVDNAEYRKWLLSADASVQLRGSSRGETSAALLDCWNYRIATVINAHGALGEIPPDSVIPLPESFSDSELTQALTRLWSDSEFRVSVGKKGREKLIEDHNPRICADAYANAIEEFYDKFNRGIGCFQRSLSTCKTPIKRSDLLHLSKCIGENFPPEPKRQQWFVDISTLVHVDARSGIQRVVRSILRHLLLNCPEGIAVQPVYALPGKPGYFHARKFTCRMLEIDDEWCEDTPIEAWAGDTFLALDLQHGVIIQQAAFLQSLRVRGIRLVGVVYDLLPVLFPDYFEAGISELHQRWLEEISEFDQALCISRAVADDLENWLDAFANKNRKLPFEISYFHLGADLEDTQPTTGIPLRANELIDIFNNKDSFLMVSTVEPRKGHKLVLEAFDEMWASGCDFHLIIVGKMGWLVDELAHRIRSHDQLGLRLHWFENISDEFLQKIYNSSSCLIAASEGEGFGLPIIEAARYRLPIIARDIPIFREVAGNGATYFDGDCSPSELAEVIKNWNSINLKAARPNPKSIKWLTWEQSAGSVMDILLRKERPYLIWTPGTGIVFWGNDHRFSTEIGRRVGISMRTSGKAGFLIFGPYLPMLAGRYIVSVSGKAKRWAGTEQIDWACDGGANVIKRQELKGTLGEWSLSFDLDLEEDLTDFEIRIYVDSMSDLDLCKIQIVHRDGRDL